MDTQNADQDAERKLDMSLDDLIKEGPTKQGNKKSGKGRGRGGGAGPMRRRGRDSGRSGPNVDSSYRTRRYEGGRGGKGGKGGFRGARGRFGGKGRYQFESSETRWQNAKMRATEITETPDGGLSCYLHDTEVVKISSAGDIILNSGGWYTKMTRETMNEVLDEYGYEVLESETNPDEWQVSDGRYKLIKYYDGLVIKGAAYDETTVLPGYPGASVRSAGGGYGLQQPALLMGADGFLGRTVMNGQGQGTGWQRVVVKPSNARYKPY